MTHVQHVQETWVFLQSGFKGQGTESGKQTVYSQYCKFWVSARKLTYTPKDPNTQAASTRSVIVCKLTNSSQIVCRDSITSHSWHFYFGPNSKLRPRHSWIIFSQHVCLNWNLSHNMCLCRCIYLLCYCYYGTPFCLSWIFLIIIQKHNITS